MAQWMYGKNVVKQILSDGGRAKAVYVTQNDQEIRKLAEKAGVPVKQVDRKALTKLCKNDHHQGCAVEIEPYETYTVEELVSSVKEEGRGFLIMLDELEDPHNLGAVLRTADAVGADGVIFKKTHNAGLTPTVAKVSAGAVDTVKCAAVTNLTRTAEDLKAQGWWIIGTAMDGQDYRSLDYAMNVVLVIGNEGKGISRLLREKCDMVVSIPMDGKIDSLNAAVSAGILMYAVRNARHPL